MSTMEQVSLKERDRIVRRSDFALIEPAQISFLDRSDLDHAIVPESFRAQAELFPALLDLHALDAEERSRVFDRAAQWESDIDTPFFSAFLMAPSNPAHVATHLARRIVVVTPNGAEDALRFYDPYVFRHLLWMFSPRQMDSLLGPIVSWSWREPSGDWLTYTRESSHASVSPLLPSRDQWEMLKRLADVNRVLRRLSVAMPELSNDGPLAQRLDGLIAESWVQYQMADREDRCLYAEQAIRFDPRIHEHPELNRRLQLTRTGSSTYVGACADLNEPRMREMSSELDTKIDGERI